jgi:hypothetical protein
MEVLFPILLIAIGIAVLLFGSRLAVLGAAIGALLGVALLHLFDGSGGNPLLALAIPGLLAVIGFFAAGFAKGIVNLLILAMGALAGAVIIMAFIDLFTADAGLWYWVLALVGAFIGLVVVRRFKEPALIVLAGLIGGLLVTRGLSAWMDSLQGALGTLLVIVLAGASIAYQSGMLGKRGGGTAAADTGAAAPPAPPTPPPAAPTP